MNAALAAIVAGSIAWLALAFLLRRGLLPQAQPNDRSLHCSAIVQGAGLAIWAGVAASLAWSPKWPAWVLALSILIVVSLRDDRYGVPVSWRLGAHVAAATSWAVLSGTTGAIALMTTVLVIVWMTNLYNFMDGSDGLAGAMTIVGFAAYALAGSRVDAPETPLAAAVVGATLPFIVVNWPPARAFLGDVGAVPLGFLAAALGIAGWQAQWWPYWFPPLVFLPFIADATATLVRRLTSGERVWRAHRDHYYQRLVRMRFGHAGTLALYAALMAGTAGSALAALFRAPDAGVALLALWTAALLLLFAAIDRSWRMQVGAG